MGLLDKLLKVKAKDFQKVAIKEAIRRKYFVIGDDMGLGKTLEALSVAVVTHSKALIVCPSYLRYNWQEEIENLLKGEFRVKVCNGSKDVPYSFEDWDFIILSYAISSKAELLFHMADMVICDESHYLKNLSAGRTETIHKYVYESKVERFLLLSGTPIKNRVGEWYSPLVLMSYCPGDSNGVKVTAKYPSFYSFCGKFSYKKLIETPNGRIAKYKGIRNVPELKELLKGKYIRRTSDQVLDLPGKEEQDIIVDYKHDLELLKAWEEHNEGNKVDSSLKRKSAVKKASFTAKFVRNLVDSGHGPVVVFSDHIEPVHTIESELKNSLRVGAIIGETNSNKRISIINKFKNKELDVLVATIGSCSTGHNLVVSNTMVFNDKSWVGADNDQALKRIIRIGQTRKSKIYTISGSPQDSHINKLLTSKKREVEAAT